MTRTFIETTWFTKRWQEIGFDDEALRSLQIMIMQNPGSGRIISGTGGVRKLRFAFLGRGKSGSVRVCYVDFARYETVYLLTVYRKSDRESLSAEEKSILRQLVNELKAMERIIYLP